MTSVARKKYAQALLKTPIFFNMPPAIMNMVLDNSNIQVYKKNETIFSDKTLCVLLEGTSTIYKNTCEHRIIMNKLNPGGIFGLVNLFNGGEFVFTEVLATSKCIVIHIPEALLKRVFIIDFNICQNYISYLTQRINFLHLKIDAFTETSVEKKIFLFLKNNWEINEQTGNAEVTLPVSLTEFAEVLDVGRASLYRVFRSSSHILLREGRKIIIKNPDGVTAYLEQKDLTIKEVSDE